MKHKKGLLCLIGLIVIFLCFAAYSFITTNDAMPIPENAKILEFDAKNNYSDELVRYHYDWENREKTGEDDDYYYYKITDSEQDYTIAGYVQLKLDKEHVNGTTDDLKLINSVFKEIINHEYNNTHFGTLHDRDSSSEYDGINYAENLDYSAYNGENAYINIYDENGEISLTKKLDEFFFTCTGNENLNYYILGFDSISGDVMDIYRGVDENSKVELVMIINSTDNAYVLKIPLEIKFEEDMQIDRNY